MGQTVELVWFVTGLSMVGYGTLVGLERLWAEQPVSAEQAAAFLLTQATMGLLFHLMLRRVRSSQEREAGGRSTTVLGG